jgi:hypothetical protein
MSLPPQRFFSLTNSTKNSTSTSSSSEVVPVSGRTITGGTRFLDPSPLDLLLRIENKDKYGVNTNNGISGMSWLNNLGAAPTPGDNNGNSGAPTSRAIPEMNNPIANTNSQNQSFQQAFLQSMSQQSGGGSSRSTILAPPQGGQSRGGFNIANNGGTSTGQANQFGNIFGGSNQARSSGFGGLPQDQQASSQGQWNDLGYSGGGASSLVAQTATQGDMISKLVASLQAQQQAQQQAQVQAMLARAFGTGASGRGTFDLVGGLGGLGGGIGGIGNSSGTSSYVNNISNGGINQGSGGGIVQGMKGLGDAGNGISGQGSALSQQNFAPHDLLSRMVQQRQQQHDDTIADNNLIKLQIDQEQHNRMLQIVQADRQERAILANQDALMLKTRWDMNNSGGNDGITPEGGVGGNDDKMKNIFSQYPQVAAASGFSNGVNSSLLNVPGLNSLQQFSNSNVSSIVGGGNYQGGSNHGGLNAAALQSNLLSAGMNSLVGPRGMLAGGVDSSASGVGGAPGIMEGHHLNQKLSMTRGTAIVPCRARGMPVDHNFKSAYFVIPENIEHGDELICSYPACRQAGIKFRYCFQCKVPVAKRNFRNRHRHGVAGGELEDGESSDLDGESEDEMSEEGSRRVIGLAEDGDICHPVSALAQDADGEDDDDYRGVKKEHILIIPGIDSAAAAPTNIMGKKKRKNVNIRVPCRARGMPMAHNFKTAYFIIPPTIEHGDELLCSFPSCRSAGAKFRYCLHCKVPVAKRNFRNRHKHGSMGVLDKKKAGGNPTSPQGEERTNPMVGTSEAVSAAHVNGDLLMPPLGAHVAIMDSKVHNSDSGSTVTITSTQEATRVQKWVELLENKPDPENKAAMAAWMMSLMNATEGAAPAAVPAAAAVDSQVKISPAVDVLAAATGRLGESVPKDEGVADASISFMNENVKVGGGGGEDEDEDEDDAPPNKKIKHEFEQV